MGLYLEMLRCVEGCLFTVWFNLQDAIGFLCDPSPLENESKGLSYMKSKQCVLTSVCHTAPSLLFLASVSRDIRLSSRLSQSQPHGLEI